MSFVHEREDQFVGRGHIDSRPKRGRQSRMLCCRFDDQLMDLIVRKAKEDGTSAASVVRRMIRKGMAR